MAKSKRSRKTSDGFVGVDLAKGGDMTLYNRLEKEVKDNLETNRSQIIRLALTEYFERKDKNK